MVMVLAVRPEGELSQRLLPKLADVFSFSLSSRIALVEARRPHKSLFFCNFLFFQSMSPYNPCIQIYTWWYRNQRCLPLYPIQIYPMPPQINPVLAQLIADKLTTGTIPQQDILRYPAVAPATIYRHAACIHCLGTLYALFPSVLICRLCLITLPMEAGLVDLLA